MSNEIKINQIEVQKINLQPGDVLMVTVQHEDVNEEALYALKNTLTGIFPDNKIMLFSMSSEGYVKFTVASQSQPQKNYCEDCDCGKKQEWETKND